MRNALQAIAKPIRQLRAARNFKRLVENPDRLEEVFNLSDRSLDPRVLSRLVTELSVHERGRRALTERRRLPRYDLADLARLPQESLGQEFAAHMARNQLDPAAIPTLPGQSEAEFIRAHLYETHDIWHAVVGFATDVAGELGLQGFYMAQIRGPLPPIILAAGLLNTAFGASAEFHPRMAAITDGWQAGVRAEPLFGVDWDDHWGRPLCEVRRELGLPVDGVSAEWRRAPSKRDPRLLRSS